MTKVKLCGLTRPEDVAAANACMPDYVGFVFAPRSRRYVTPRQVAALRARLDPRILAVGVFVQTEPAVVARLLEEGVIHMAQLHGGQDEAYLHDLRELTGKPVIQAFRMDGDGAVQAAQASLADYVLLDQGDGGTGRPFDWALAKGLSRPYFLAGGLNPENAAAAVEALHPYALDVSSGIETDGRKDPKKMAAFVAAVRGKG